MGTVENIVISVVNDLGLVVKEAVLDDNAVLPAVVASSVADPECIVGKKEVVGGINDEVGKVENSVGVNEEVVDSLARVEMVACSVVVIISSVEVMIEFALLERVAV